MNLSKIIPAIFVVIATIAGFAVQQYQLSQKCSGYRQTIEDYYLGGFTGNSYYTPHMLTSSEVTAQNAYSRECFKKQFLFK